MPFYDLATTMPFGSVLSQSIYLKDAAWVDVFAYYNVGTRGGSTLCLASNGKCQFSSGTLSASGWHGWHETTDAGSIKAWFNCRGATKTLRRVQVYPVVETGTTLVLRSWNGEVTMVWRETFDLYKLPPMLTAPTVQYTLEPVQYAQEPVHDDQQTDQRHQQADLQHTHKPVLQDDHHTDKYAQEPVQDDQQADQHTHEPVYYQQTDQYTHKPVHGRSVYYQQTGYQQTDKYAQEHVQDDQQTDQYMQDPVQHHQQPDQADVAEEDTDYELV